MRYAIVIEKAENNYSAYVPDLPGCVATGASLEEVEVEIREAIEFHLEGLHAACASCGAQLSPTARFCSECAHPTGQVAPPSASQRVGAPEVHTPKHLAERILTSKAALEGERKQVTVLFADLRGSMELLADRDPEDARRLLDPVREHNDGGRPSLRGYGEPGDGGRDHGALRRPARPRGPRYTRLLRGAQDAAHGDSLS